MSNVKFDDEIMDLLDDMKEAMSFLSAAGGVLYDLVNRGAERSKVIEELTSIIEDQSRLQTLANAVLSVLVRRYDSKDVREGIRDGYNYSLMILAMSTMDLAGMDPEEKTKRYGRLFYQTWKQGIMAIEIFMHMKKPSLYNFAHFITTTINLNRGLLNITLELLDHYKRMMAQSTSVNKIPEHA